MIFTRANPHGTQGISCASSSVAKIDPIRNWRVVCRTMRAVSVRKTIGTSILAPANLIVLEAPALGARLVRPAEEQAVETTQFAGLILKQCAAFLAMQQVVFDWWH